MPYFTITDFAAGLDLRRSSLTAPAGTLRSLLNAHVSPGGEIEKRFAFQKFATVAANTKGLVSVNQNLYTFAPMSAADINSLHPTSRLNNHAYAVSDAIVAGSTTLLFVCETAGTTAATLPAAYATAAAGDLVTDGTAEFRARTPAGWTADVTPPSYPIRINSHVYGTDTIRVASNPTLVFLCATPGTSAETEPAAYATAAAGALITDGTAIFRAGVPPTAARQNGHVYSTDAITVGSNPNRVFTCVTPGISAATEPPAYAAAKSGELVNDGAAVFRAGTANTYAARADSHAYVVDDVVTTITNIGRLFTCTTSGTSASTEPVSAYAAAVEGTVINDGTAVFRCSVPITPYSPRIGSHAYVVDDVVTTTSNRNRIFTCTTPGTTAPAEPTSYGTAIDGGTVNDGTAVFTASTPTYPARANSQAYAADVMAVDSNPLRLFVCVTRGKSAASEPVAYAGAGDNTQVVDGTAVFLATSPIYSTRLDSHAYTADIVTVTSNPTRIFTCTTTLGTSAAAEPAAYASALDGTQVTDGTAGFLASTPTMDWLIAAQPPVTPIKTEPTSTWDIGILPLETETLFEIVDYDVFDKKVFVVAWTDITTVDNMGNVVRCYDGRSVPDATGFFVKTYRTKMYAVGGSVLSFSAIGNPFDWTGTGSGSIDLSLEDSDMTDCVAVEAYYDKLAILSKTATQLWIIDPDPLKNQYVQTLRDAGTIAWRSVLQYGSGDVMYLAVSGVRSLRARNSSLAAAVSDIGSPIDPVVQDLFRTRGEEFFASTISVLQPITGRFWVIMQDRIYVLSAFPGPKVTAWSQYDPTYTGPDGEPVPFRITAVAVHKHRIVVRDENNNVYAFGGNDPAGPVYDLSPVELIFPYHAGDQPATNKIFQALDATATGRWEVSVALNISAEDVEDFAGIVDGPTFLQGDFLSFGTGTHMSLRLRAFEPGPATLSNFIVHYQLGAPRGIGT